MTLIKSISGIRGTVGGSPGNDLTPLDAVELAAAFGRFLKKRTAGKERPKVILARDARPSGRLYADLTSGALNSAGVDVIDSGKISTPTMQMGVIMEKAQGGVILSASHNPNGWNALKMVGEDGEFLSEDEMSQVLEMVREKDKLFVKEDEVGEKKEDNTFLERHIERILSLDEVDCEAIAKADLSVAVDGVNSVGGPSIVRLLERLGVRKISKLNCDNSGVFSHNPEPLDNNLKELSREVRERGCDIGLAVDPDGDRLSLICDGGDFFNEEYTVAAAADYILAFSGGGDTVSNISSSLVLKDVTEKHGGKHFYSAVGEANVVAKMKETEAVIGGEGNGGVIFPKLHYGRDSLVGTALILSFLAGQGLKMSDIKKKYPAYYICKKKIEFKKGTDIDDIIKDFKERHKGGRITDIDGVRVDLDKSWVHIRRSNTEPIIRIYAEGESPEEADALSENSIKDNFK